MIYSCPEAYKRALLRRRFTHIGSGMFADVYGDPGGQTAVRVSSGPVAPGRELQERFDGWPHYIGWAEQAGFLGTFAPAVTAFRRVAAHDGWELAFYVAAMERLECTLPEARALGRHEQAQSLAASAVAAIADAIAREGGGPLAEEVVRAAASRGVTARIECPRLAAFVSAFIGDIVRDQGTGMDALHGKNWMVRRDGSLVLVDPLAAPSCTGTWPRMVRPKVQTAPSSRRRVE